MEVDEWKSRSMDSEYLLSSTSSFMAIVIETFACIIYPRFWPSVRVQIFHRKSRLLQLVMPVIASVLFPDPI